MRDDYGEAYAAAPFPAAVASLPRPAHAPEGAPLKLKLVFAAWARANDTAEIIHVDAAVAAQALPAPERAALQAAIGLDEL